jgi:hypothetical protein
MDRRNFIKTGSFLIASAAAAPAMLNSQKLFARQIKKANFSFSIVTDDEDRAILLGEKLIKEAYPDAGRIIFREYSIAGIHTGDIVYLKDNRLINYKSDLNNLSSELRDIAKELELPRKINNPSCIRFYTENDNTASRFLVFHKDILIQKIEPGISRKSYSIRGSKGNLIVETSNNKAKVIESSCTHKTCMSMKSISRSSEYIVCIPNEVQIIGE